MSRPEIPQGRLSGVLRVGLADDDPESLPILHRADRLRAVVIVADAHLRLVAHLHLGNHGAHRRIPARELDACDLADQAAAAVAADEVLRAMPLAVGHADVDAVVVLR